MPPPSVVGVRWPDAQGGVTFRDRIVPIYAMTHEAPPSRSSSRYWVPMLGHSFRVLDALRHVDEDLSLQEVTARVRVTKTSAFRILFTLEHLGYVQKHPKTARYRLAPKASDAAEQPAALPSSLGDTLKEIVRSYGSRLIGQRPARTTAASQP